jgi:nitrogenase molybdenum-cofactor synthesis protein NifE
MIAPALCAHNARLMVSHWEHSSMDIENNLVFLLYEEDDIIHGASDKIRQAIMEAIEKNSPDVLFVVSSCLPEIVGEDIEAIVRQVRVAQAKVPVLFIKTENFTEITTRKGLEYTMAAFMDLMPACTERKTGAINIIGSNAEEFPATELARILERAGFLINVVFPSRCDLSRLREAPKAEFNIVMNRHSGMLAEQMKTAFGIPYFRFEPAYSPDAILEKYRELSEFLGKDLQNLVKPDYDMLKGFVAGVDERHHQSSIILSLNSGRVFDLAFLLKQSGMDILVIGTNEVSDDDRTDARRLLEVSPGTQVVRNLSWHPLDECIADMRPDYFLAFGGPEAPFCARYGVKHRNVIFRPYLNGFAAAVRVLETILNEKPGYTTLVLREQMKEKAGLT